VEEVIDWQDGHSYTVKLSDGDMPLKKAIATMSIKARCSYYGKNYRVLSELF